MNGFKKLLVVITESSDPRPAFERALKLARHAESELTLLDIAELVPEETESLIPLGILDALKAASLEHRTAALMSLAEEARRAGVPVLTELATGSAFQIAIRAVLTKGYDLVLKTIDRRDMASRSLHGSTDKHLLRKCPCPFWLSASTDEHENAHILAAVNPDPHTLNSMHSVRRFFGQPPRLQRSMARRSMFYTLGVYSANYSCAVRHPWSPTRKWIASSGRR
jgi:nucleotide-binding universal stress UspA family protein